MVDCTFPKRSVGSLKSEFACLGVIGEFDMLSNTTIGTPTCMHTVKSIILHDLIIFCSLQFST